jgi:hypothetical protein
MNLGDMSEMGVRGVLGADRWRLTAFLPILPKSFPPRHGHIHALSR